MPKLFRLLLIFTAFFCSVSLQVAHGQIVAATTKRMIVMLKPDAVERQNVRASDKVENVFADQRVQKNPAIWSAVSVKTATLVRDLETTTGTKAFLAFGYANHGFAAMLTAQQITTLKSDSRVKEVFEDVPGRLASSTPPTWADTPSPVTASTYTTGWNLHAINLYNSGSTDTPAYRTNGSYPVKTYVIDAGMQPHDDLNFNPAVDYISFDCHSNEGGTCPDAGSPSYVYSNACDSHATHVAGIIGARMQTPTAYGVEGVAPNAQLVSVRVINYCDGASGYPGLPYTSGVLAAINWIASQVPNNGTDGYGQRRLSGVANMSIVWDVSTLPSGGASALTSAITSAVDNGVFFSFAAGNSNQNACDIYPGAIARNIGGAMAVGALQSNGSAMNLGTKIASSGPCVEIWAPGQEVHSTVVYPGPGGYGYPGATGYAPMSGAWGGGTVYDPGLQYYAPNTGSSMAAPHVAGAALLVARKFQLASVALPSPAGIEWIINYHAKGLLSGGAFGTYDPLGLFSNPADKQVKVLTVDDL